jgi:hypothetical protein
VEAGAACWLPSILLHFIGEFNGPDALMLTLLMPAVALIAVWLAWVHRGLRSAWNPGSVLLGMWSLGPFAILINFTAAGGGYAGQQSVLELLQLAIMFPVTTWMMAAYDGSIGGLMLSSVLLFGAVIFALLKGRGKQGPGVTN